MLATDTSATLLLTWGVIGYLIGSIPFGLLVSRAMGLGDLRKLGSGNIGATNVLRTGSKSAAALTLVLDGGKGIVAVLLARYIGGEGAVQIAALAVFLGHCYPVWLGFRGGKGVATFLGVLLALAWPVGLAACATWLAAAFASRISSVAAITAAAASTFWMLFLGAGHYMVLGAVLTLLVFWRHRENLRRLRAGSEPRIGAK